MKDHKILKSAKELPIEEAAEAFIDAFVTSDVLSGVPVVGTAMGIFKAFKTYKNEGLKAKLRKFLVEVGELSQSELDGFVGENKKSDEPLLIEHLLELVEQAESEQKAMIIGVLFRRLVKRKISREQFSDQVRFTKQIYIIDLFHFMGGYHNQYLLQDGLGDILTNYRICKRTTELAYRDKNFLSQEKLQFINTTYEITGIGKSFLLSLHDAYKDKIAPERLLTD